MCREKGSLLLCTYQKKIVQPEGFFLHFWNWVFVSKLMCLLLGQLILLVPNKLSCFAFILFLNSKYIIWQSSPYLKQYHNIIKCFFFFFRYILCSMLIKKIKYIHIFLFSLEYIYFTSFIPLYPWNVRFNFLLSISRMLILTHFWLLYIEMILEKNIKTLWKINK